MPDSLLDLDSLLVSWLRHLQAERKSPRTVRAYRAAVRSFLKFCADTGRPAELDRGTVIAYLADHPGEAATARLNLAVLRLFGRWLAAEENVPFNLADIPAPKVNQRVVSHLTDHEVGRLLAACAGREPRDLRDRALIALFTETGLRASEMLDLNVEDVDLDGHTVLVRSGKGGRGRRCRFSVGTCAALDKWLRARHRAGNPAKSGPLWVSGRGALSYHGLCWSLKARAAAAGVVGFHVHRLRHTAAVRWLRAGGTEAGLRAHAGWSSNSMVERYVSAASEQLAAEEFDRLDLDATEV